MPEAARKAAKDAHWRSLAKAVSWRPVDVGETDSAVYLSGGRCGRNPPEMRSPREGDSVELRWVDTYGRLSPPSAATTVVKGP